VVENSMGIVSNHVPLGGQVARKNVILCNEIQKCSRMLNNSM
jgi:hypothetical protein